MAKANGLERLDSACVDLVLLLYNVHLFVREVLFTFHHGESTLKSRFGEIPGSCGTHTIYGSNHLEKNNDNVSGQIYSHVVILKGWRPTDGEYV